MSPQANNMVSPSQEPESKLENFNNTPPSPYPAPVMPLTNVQQPVISPPSGTGAVVVTHMQNAGPGAAAPVFGAPKSGKFKWKVPLLVTAFVLVIGAGGAFAYFGYYMNPSVIWKQALSNTDKGYERLVGYVDEQAKTQYGGAKVDGTFKGDIETQHFDGEFTGASDKDNAQSSATLNTSVGSFVFEMRSLKAKNVDEPDFYVQVSGIKKLNETMDGSLPPQVVNLDGQWIVVDHNVLATWRDQVASTRTEDKAVVLPTAQDVNTFLKQVGNVNREYLFTTKEDKAVLKIVKKYGQETVDGRKTYRYKVGFNNANTKAYNEALCNAVRETEVGKYITSSLRSEPLTAEGCKKEADAIAMKESDTFDAWVALDSRLPYKIRVSDPKQADTHYSDIGLNYKGDNLYPFFVRYKHDKTNVAVTATLDGQTNKLTVDMEAKSDDGDSPSSFDAHMTVQPTKDPVKVTPPENAKPITDVLKEFGLTEEALQETATQLSPDSLAI